MTNNTMTEETGCCEMGCRALAATQIAGCDYCHAHGVAELLRRRDSHARLVLMHPVSRVAIKHRNWIEGIDAQLARLGVEVR